MPQASDIPPEPPRVEEHTAGPLAGHTEGPWMVLGDGVTVAQRRKSHRTHVCRAFEIYGDRAEREANARLIAVAPDMLLALWGLLDRYLELVNSGDAGFWNPEEEPEVIAARAALAAIPGPDAEGGRSDGL